jgi:bis(5'-nucleosyl)-tetraphosphatase (symmetrical)
MATYLLGDIQGCRQQLESLLDVITFNPDADTLIFTGDLVNRGPDSVGTLRLVKALGDSAKTVLGNHDLHLLAVAYTGQHRSAKDNFNDVLEAPDKLELLNWLENQPLVIADNQLLVTHAGVPPQWNKQQTISFGNELAEVINGGGERALSFYQKMYGNQPRLWSKHLAGNERLRFITNALTRMRYCEADMGLDLACKLPPAKAPKQLVPWFKHPHRNPVEGIIAHGHWAALSAGEFVPNVISLDAGCVWGQQLCAWRLEDSSWHFVPGLAVNE